MANSRTKPPVPTRGSKADVMDGYDTEEAFDLRGIDMKDCHSSLRVKWGKPLRATSVRVPPTNSFCWQFGELQDWEG